MNQHLIFLPVLVQITMVCIIYVYLGKVKTKALQKGEVDEARRALHADAWPDSVLKVSNNLRNQFESPVLFYALTFILWALKAVDIFSLGIACVFVVLRIVHAFVHMGSNNVPLRKRVFVFSCVMLIAMVGLATKAILSAGIFS